MQSTLYVATRLTDASVEQILMDFLLEFEIKNHILPLYLLPKSFMSAIPPAQKSFIDKAVMEENIALDSYLNCMLSPCDEWEQHILVYVYLISDEMGKIFFFTVVIILTFC